MHHSKFIPLLLGFCCLCDFLCAATLPSKSDEANPRLHPIGGYWGFRRATEANPNLPRVLLIGDSIVGAYKDQVTASLAGKANVDVWTTGLHEGHPDLLPLLRDVLANGPYAIVHFNIGLHGWPKGRIPEGQYEPLMRRYVAVLRTEAPTARLIWASTTPVTVRGVPGILDPEINPIIAERNVIAARIMAENHIAVDDLNRLMADKLDLGAGDQFHWSEAGVEVQSQAVAACILKNLPGSGKK
jgi:hypothetical protein